MWLLVAALLVGAGAGTAAVLAHHARPAPARTAVPADATVTTVGDRPFLRVSPPHTVFIHLAAATASSWTARTMCGLPWRATADADAEVGALLRGTASAVCPGESVCPVCVREAVALATGASIGQRTA